MKIPSTTLIDYIKTSIEILVEIRAEELLKQKTNKNKKQNNSNKSRNETENDYEDLEQMETSPNEYEKLLRKHEADIRNYIKVNR